MSKFRLSLRSLCHLLCFAPLLLIARANDFESHLLNADLIILEEQTNLIVSGQKSYLMNFTVEKDITYQINNDQGIAWLDSIMIPEPLDPTYILHAPEIRENVGSISGLKVNRFSAVLEKTDGTVRTLQPTVRIHAERLIKTSLGEAFHHYYCLDGLEVGDILRISYSYTFLFKENWYKLFSTRVFFHSGFPKKSVSLTLSHPSALKIDTFLVNLAPPVFQDENGRKSYSWKMEDLPGCLNEPWSRPYRDLPNFTFSLKPYELIYEEFNSFKQQFVPLWLMLCFYRETDISVATVDHSIGAKDKDNLMYEKIAAKYRTMAGSDPSGLRSLQFFQRYMADSVEYKDAHDYYNNEENYKVHRPAIELQGGVMQDFAMEQIYAHMILKLGLNFFTAYPTDKRSGEISTRYFSPMYDNDVIFAAILKNEVTSYVLPRSEKNRYYVEELPFYYEDIPVMLVNSYDFGGYKLNILDSARIIRTPESLLADNTRKATSAATISIDSGTVDFQTSLTLKGQYATLCRFSYSDKPNDLTVNPRYHKRVCDISDQVILNKNEVSATQLLFPFTTKINCAYVCRDLVEKTTDGCVIHMDNWVNHVIPDGFSPDFRYTDFYPDFVGADNFTYELTFDHNVKLAGENKNIQLKREFGSYSFAIIQTAPDKLLMVSTFSLTSPAISKSVNSEVAEMMQAIEERRALDLLVQVVP